MTLSPRDAELTELLKKARVQPLILKSPGTGDFALLALDDEVIDLLLERHPKLIAECQQIRTRMRQGAYRTHEQILAELNDKPESGP